MKKEYIQPKVKSVTFKPIMIGLSRTSAQKDYLDGGDAKEAIDDGFEDEEDYWFFRK